MEEIKQLIGFWLVCLGVCTFITMVFGWDMETKDKVRLVACTQSFIALLEISLYLMGV